MSKKENLVELIHMVLWRCFQEKTSDYAGNMAFSIKCVAFYHFSISLRIMSVNPSFLEVFEKVLLEKVQFFHLLIKSNYSSRNIPFKVSKNPSRSIIERIQIRYYRVISECES